MTSKATKTGKNAKTEQKPIIKVVENECLYCEKIFDDYDELKIHITEKHKAIICNYCDTRFNGTIELEKHISEKHDEEKEEEEDKEEETDEKKAEAVAKEKMEALKKIAEKEEEREFQKIFNGEKGLAEIYVDYNKSNIKLKDTKTCSGYYYSQINSLWQEKEKQYFISECMNFLEHHLVDELKKYIERPEKNRDADTQKKLTLILNKCRGEKFVENIFKIASPYLVDTNFCENINLKDETKYLISFKNGVYDLKTGKLRNRTKEDCMSECLSYDYKEDNVKIKKIKEEIIEIIKKISNDNDEDLKFNLGWLGYNITGETKEQKFLIGTGEKASNGKSTLYEMYEACLPIYTLKMKNNTFNKNNSKSHKQFAMLVGKPIRMAYIEEMDETVQDTSLIKDFTGGKKLTNEVMFGTMVKGGIRLHCKITLIGNKSVVFAPDRGVLRRGMLEEFRTIFMEEKDYKKLPIERRKGKYIKNKNLSELFNDDDYKMAFVSILIEYAQKYIKEGLYIPEHVEENFNSLYKENDSMEAFINEFYDITENDKDRVHKDDFTDLYNMKFKTKKKWVVIMSDLKRILTYDGKARELDEEIKDKKGKVIKTIKSLHRQGCILGIKPKNNKVGGFGDGCELDEQL